MAEYHSISDLVKLSINNKQELWQVVLTGQAHDKLMSERDVFAQMKKMYQAMKSADEQYDQQLRSPSKMVLRRRVWCGRYRYRTVHLQFV